MTVDIRKRQGKDEYNISITPFNGILVWKGFEINEYVLNIYLSLEELKNLKEEINRLRLK